MSEDPAAVWPLTDHLLATVSNWLGELTYITAAANSDPEARKKMTRPEPIERPGQTRTRRHTRRPRIGAPISPSAIGGVPIDTTAEVVT